ncbi:branched-chain amino acid ABC transporter permease [Pusillimonas noertemannii]|uniref:Amino acid/amide ABC transporter membrane protein 2 (HAAT family) n=1 Tax=Pusillimonas noertemannii TaxID=305977 RepID=A0A2U1CJH1_9BURK|nr:branched-chain amino acid ABC transporter permease [Pusillimonas noertemannii]NYT69920.1 branched-chain amino acid ABC transporter permease [Pusillimonas noertemannii]PVY61156.1 amino acid/amide ABC transporter membrane protein 2 (HAAT family) [Pusillimonas noertemannii]TFL09214.1 branched-chain amino acid ABC transporter permease [Pusillimonas noertemannii]
MHSTLHHRLSGPWIAALLIALLAFPPVAAWFGQEFYISFGSRLIIFALVASSLNLILGFGGMVSLGHAAYFGAGAYVVAILMYHDLPSAWLSWPAAVLVGAVLAFLIGLVCLRTRGVYFIMITLAFAQMTYYIFVSLRSYGGDDGLAIMQRSQLGIDLSSDTVFYYVCLALTVAVLFLMHRLVNARFGRVLQGIRENETRMQAIGYPVFRFKLAAFVIAGAIAALGGALFANQNYMASPSQLHWMQSGTLMVMVLVGGLGYFFGGVIGAVTLLVLEEILMAYTTHWAFILGFVLLAIVLFLPNGLASLALRRPRRADAPTGDKP